MLGPSSEIQESFSGCVVGSMMQPVKLQLLTKGRPLATRTSEGSKTKQTALSQKLLCASL